jgi:hypothetical protein
LDAVKKLLCKRDLNLAVRGAHDLVGGFCPGCKLRTGYLLIFVIARVAGRPFPEQLELIKLS